MDELLIKKFGLQITSDLQSFSYVSERKAFIPYSLAKQKKVLPLEENSDGIVLGVSDPTDLKAIKEVKLLLKKNILPIYVSKPLLERAIEQCYHQKEEETKELFLQAEKKGSSESHKPEDGYDLLEKVDENPVIRMVNSILLEAIQYGASDIHFEPAEKGLFVRYRMDGILQQKHVPLKDFQTQILTRLKVMAKMDIAEHRLPQDGRIKLHHGGREIDFRVSTLPTVHGERIVIRILDKGNVVLGLDQLKMDPSLLKQFKRLVESPEGIILVTGPTGSGKTTTLYSALSEVNDVDVNIITVEDPVEYKLMGISQMSVSPQIDLTFAKGLRHILRQDPDVIMIGEIRDRETAEIAIQASLTGHLVFSTLHTNDAPSALTRLSDMGIEPYLLASSILAILAQRLVRTICPHCKVFYTPTDEELSELSLKRKQLQNNQLAKGKGCKECFHSGYKGRLALYELMHMSSKLKSQVLKSPDGEKLRKIAIQEKMTSLFENGMEQVLKGLTTGSEVLRVTKSEEMKDALI